MSFLLEKKSVSMTCMCTLLDRCICKVYFNNVLSFCCLQAKLEEDLPHEVVSKIHLVDLAGR